MDILKDAKAFVSCPSGGKDFGTMDGPEIKAAGINVGPIRLQVGFPGTKGFGFLHVQTNSERMKQIEGMGFKGCTEFCAAIAENYSHVGTARDGRMTVVWKRKTDELVLILEWKDHSFWTIVTAVPTRKARKYELICEVVRTGGREPTPDVAIRNRFATLSLPKKR